MQETQVGCLLRRFPGQGNYNHFSILAWEAPEETGGLQSTGSRKSQIWLSDWYKNISKYFLGIRLCLRDKAFLLSFLCHGRFVFLWEVSHRLCRHPFFLWRGTWGTLEIFLEIFLKDLSVPGGPFLLWECFPGIKDCTKPLDNSSWSGSRCSVPLLSHIIMKSESI